MGANFGPDGRLYVLKRGFNGLGFKSQVRRFEITRKSLLPAQVVFENQYGVFYNRKGLAIWRNTQDQVTLRIVSDNNFNPLETTQQIDFNLPFNMT